MTRFSLVFALAISACSPPDIAKRVNVGGAGVALVDGFDSMMVESEVRALAWSRMKGQALEEATRNPRALPDELLKEVNLEYENLPLLGHAGRLRFDYYHGRLARIVFFPRDHDAFVKQLQLGLHSVARRGGTRVAVNANNVVWLDERLMEAIRPGYR